MNRIQNYQQLAEDIKNWIKDYATSNKFTTLVVGVSGGIDSAVVSTLCAGTGINTIALNLPLYSDSENTRLSNLQLDFLKSTFDNVNTYLIDLTESFKTFNEIKLIHENFNSKLGFANTKSRLRMVTLYQIAASSNGIVVGTGNKVEDFGVGFYTKYGDGGVDISPIADLYKTEVRELGRYLGVPEEIILAEPTDGLWDDNRKDTDQIGASYEELECIMNWIDSDYKSPLSSRQKKVLEIYQQFNSKNSHKMKSIPVFKIKYELDLEII
jgi:NAD+ synthase